MTRRWRGAIVEFSELGDAVERPVKTYSSGMFLRLAFSVAIHTSPDVLIVDEALAVGDEAFQRRCFGRIEQLRESGVTILFVSHAASTVMQVCDRALLLDARASMEAAPRVAQLLAEELGRDEAWRRAQVDAFCAIARGYVL